MSKANKNKPLQIILPGYVITTAQKLLKHNYSAYLVGGPVRDTLLKRTPHDYDIATDATPQQVKQIFKHSIDVGEKFGTVVVIIKLNNSYKQIEITTLRAEKNYIKNRKPSTVTFITDISTDLQRRDFTINAMALDLTPTLEIQTIKDQDQISLSTYLIDMFNGQQDLKDKIIRAVGNPDQRLKEDALRIIRGCRFASQLNFNIENNTLQAMKKHAHLLNNISKERIRDELIKILLSPKPSIGINYLLQTDSLQYVIPELLNTIGVKQKIGHAHDVYTHLLKATDTAPANLEIRLAALLHDIAKPECDTGDGHFYGHDVKGAQQAAIILKRLRFPKKLIKKVTTLIRWHMFYYPGYENQNTEKQKNFWTDAAVRRFLKRVGPENIDDLFKLRVADATSNPKSLWNPKEIEELQKHINRILQEDTALKLKDLAVNGTDIITYLRLKPGKIIGDILNYLLDKVIENPRLNTKTQLLKLAEKYLKDIK